jgi:hypothetical protein
VDVDEPGEHAHDRDLARVLMSAAAQVVGE